MASEFKIGDTLLGIESLDEILESEISIDPDWSFQAYSTNIRLGNGLLKGMGYPVIRWRWRAMSDANREILKEFVGSNLSAPIYIRSATNETNEGAITFATYYGVMNWPAQDEDFQADKILDLVIIFTHLVLQS